MNRRCPVCHRRVHPTAANNIAGHTDISGLVCLAVGLPYDTAERGRPIKAGTPRRQHPEQLKNCTEANLTRSKEANRRRVAQAHKAIRALETQPAAMKTHGMHRTSLRVLLARIRHPDSTLAEIAGQLGVTKDTYSARLRRAYEYAEGLEVHA